jgi:hypothetical protein
VGGGGGVLGLGLGYEGAERRPRQQGSGGGGGAIGAVVVVHGCARAGGSMRPFYRHTGEKVGWVEASRGEGAQL